MTTQNKTTLKGYFNTGDQPTEAQFANLIDTLGLLRQSNDALQADEGGDARGNQAIDLQQTRGDDTQVASGNYSIIKGGFYNKAIGNASTVEGYGSLSDGLAAHAEGYFCHAETGWGTHAEGMEAYAKMNGEHAFAAGKFAAVGDAQGRRIYVKRAISSHTVNTWTELLVGGAQIIIPSDTLWQFEIALIGLTSGAAQHWSYHMRGTIVNDGGVTSILGTVTPTVLFESDAAYECQAIADDTNDALSIQVRRTAGTDYNIRWGATVRIAQVSFP